MSGSPRSFRGLLLLGGREGGSEEDTVTAAVRRKFTRTNLLLWASTQMRAVVACGMPFVLTVNALDAFRNVVPHMSDKSELKLTVEEAPGSVCAHMPLAWVSAAHASCMSSASCMRPDTLPHARAFPL